MATKHPDDAKAQLLAHHSPAVTRFAEYAAGELWRRIKRTALEDGLSEVEAEIVTGLSVKALVRALAGNINQVKFDRRVRRGS